MPTITLKNLPRNLHRTLKDRAKAHHRSLNKEVLATLQAATSPVKAVDAATLEREAREARSQFKRIITAKEISSWTKQGRL
jgi:plasmid stability protein